MKYQTFHSIGLDGTIVLKPDADLLSTIHEAVVIASVEERHLRLTFGRVTVEVGVDDDAILLLRDWQRGFWGYLGSRPKVGPYPKPVLSEEERASDEQAEAVRQERLRSQD